MNLILFPDSSSFTVIPRISHRWSTTFTKAANASFGPPRVLSCLWYTPAVGAENGVENFDGGAFPCLAGTDVAQNLAVRDGEGHVPQDRESLGKDVFQGIPKSSLSSPDSVVFADTVHFKHPSLIGRVAFVRTVLNVKYSVTDSHQDRRDSFRPLAVILQSPQNFPAEVHSLSRSAVLPTGRSRRPCSPGPDGIPAARMHAAPAGFSNWCPESPTLALT